jgi:hypothetical protein
LKLSDLLNNKKIPSGHGFGMTKKGLPVDSWIDRYWDWQKNIVGEK